MIVSTPAYQAAIRAQVEKAALSVTVGARDAANDTPKTLAAIGEKYLLSDVSQVADPSYLIDGFGVMEPGRFKLDGAFFAFSPTNLYGTRCWWGTEQPANGNFSGTQGIRITLRSPVRLRHGLCINFDDLCGDYAPTVRIKVYLGSVLLQDKTYQNDGSGYFELLADSVDKVEVIPLSWTRPLRRAKIADIYFGGALAFGGNKITGLDLTEDIAPFGSAFVASELQLTLEDMAGLFAPDRPASRYSLLSHDSLVSATLFFDLASGDQYPVSLGSYSVRTTEHDTEKGQLKIIARSLIDGYQSSYRQNSQILIDTAGNVARIIMAKLGVETFYISPAMDTQTVLDYTDECDAKTLLQELALACCHYVRPDRTGIIEFQPISLPSPATVQDYAIGNDRLVTVPKLKVASDGAYTVVLYKKYQLRTEVETIAEANLDDPMTAGSTIETWISHDLAEVTGVETTTAGCSVSLLSPGISSTLISVTSVSGTVEIPAIVIKGRLYDVEEMRVSAIKESEATGTPVEVSNRFIASKDQALALARLYDDWLALKINASFDWRGDPTVETGDIINIQTSYGTPQMLVTSSQITYDGSVSAHMEGKTNV